MKRRRTAAPPAHRPKPIVLEVSGEGLFQIHVHRPGAPRIYRVLYKGQLRRVRDEETLRKVAKSLRGYVDEHKRQHERKAFRAVRSIRLRLARIAAWCRAALAWCGMLFWRRHIEQRAERMARGIARRVAAGEIADAARQEAVKKIAAEHTAEARARDEARGFWRALRLVATEGLTPDLVGEVIEHARTDHGPGYRSYSLNGVPIPAPPRDVWRDE